MLVAPVNSLHIPSARVGGLSPHSLPRPLVVIALVLGLGYSPQVLDSTIFRGPGHAVEFPIINISKRHGWHSFLCDATGNQQVELHLVFGIVVLPGFPSVAMCDGVEVALNDPQVSDSVQV